MIQRLLRGRFLYVALGLLVVFLYVSIGPGTFEKPSTGVTVAPADQTLTWWPTAVGPEEVARAMSREPLLGVALSGLTLFTLVMACGGLLFSGWMLWTGRIRELWQFTSRRLPSWSFGELGRIMVMTMIVASLLPFLPMLLHGGQFGGGADHHVWMILSMLFLDLFVIALILVFATGKRSSLWKALGCTPRRLWASLAMGFRGYLATFPWLFLVLFIVVEITRIFRIHVPAEPIQELMFQEQRPAVLGLLMVLACGIGPVAEELFFRGVLYAAIRRRAPRLVAMLISGAAFSLVHTNLVGFIPIMALGCLLGYLYERTGSLAGPLAIHMLHNTFLMSLALVMRRLLLSG